MSLDNPTIRVRIGSPPRQGAGSQSSHPVFPELEAGYIPPVDIHEGPDGLTLEGDLPGATDQNLHIQLEDNVLHLYARIESSPPEGARLLYEEYRPGDYHRSFILSDEVDRERITAELKNGVLRVFLPKGERARTRRIEIKSPDVGSSAVGTE